MATGRLPDPNTAPVTAKGDLYTYSTVPAKLAVGNNGETLVADSSQTTGLRYNPPVGSLANPVINGGFDIWQRGTSFSIPASTVAYLADRWATVTGANQAITVSRQATADTTNLPNIQFSLRFQRNSGQTGTSTLGAYQTLETSNSIPFSGKTITLSFYAKSGANFAGTLRAVALNGTGTDQSILSGFTGQNLIAYQTITLTNTWQRFAASITVPANSTQLALGFEWSPSGTAGANDWFEVTGVQFDVGTWTASTAPTFRRSGGTLAGELAACQRYYYRQTSLNNNYENFGFGMSNGTTTAAIIPINLPVTMRTAPTSVDYSTLRLSDFGSGNSVTSLTIDGNHNGRWSAVVNAGVASGLTAYRSYALQSNNSTSGYIGFSAEL